MAKKLSDMTLEELWALFPIVLESHNPAYFKWYEAEREQLSALLSPSRIYRCHHIGSTAVKGLVAKPTVDILLELAPGIENADVVAQLVSEGWVLMSQQTTPHADSVLNKGYTPEGFAERVFHLHVRPCGDWNELYFRDYLKDHPAVADAYGRLKEILAEGHRHNRDGYTEAKTAFVTEVTALARQLYKDRYKPVHEMR